MELKFARTEIDTKPKKAELAKIESKQPSSKLPECFLLRSNFNRCMIISYETAWQLHIFLKRYATYNNVKIEIGGMNGR